MFVANHSSAPRCSEPSHVARGTPRRRTHSGRRVARLPRPKQPRQAARTESGGASLGCPHARLDPHGRVFLDAGVRLRLRACVLARACVRMRTHVQIEPLSQRAALSFGALAVKRASAGNLTRAYCPNNNCAAPSDWQTVAKCAQQGAPRRIAALIHKPLFPNRAPRA